MNAIDTDMCDLLNSAPTGGLTVYEDAVAESGKIPASKHHLQTECGD